LYISTGLNIGMKKKIYLDTHIAIWLFMNDQRRLSNVSKAELEAADIWISPIVLLEIQYLHRSSRLNYTAKAIYEDLKKRISLNISEAMFSSVIAEALSMDWTRDLFDRLITAEAKRENAPLITKDRAIRKHYKHAIW
jgi:PIN domain nuclease of toxin-antitoxin system